MTEIIKSLETVKGQTVLTQKVYRYVNRKYLRCKEGYFIPKRVHSVDLTSGAGGIKETEM